MSEIEITVKSNVKEVKEAIAANAIRALEACGQQAAANAVREISEPKPHADGSVRPNVDTGTLRRSITHYVDEGEKAVYIGTNVEYAPYLELGTIKMPEGYPFLKPAIEKNKDEYKALFEAFLSE